MFQPAGVVRSRFRSTWNAVPASVGVRSIRMGLEMLLDRSAPFDPPVVLATLIDDSGDPCPLPRPGSTGLEHRKLHVRDGVQIRLVVILDFSKGHVEARDDVGSMVLDGFPQAIGIPHILADPEIVIHFFAAGLRLVGKVTMEFKNSTTAFDFVVDQLQQVSHRAVVSWSLFKSEYFIFAGRCHSPHGVGHVAPIVVQPIQTVIVQQLNHLRQQKRSPTGTGW